MQRIYAAVFAIAFFSALPAWFLSTLEGSVIFHCAQLHSAMSCTIKESFAFNSRETTYDLTRAHLESHLSRWRGKNSVAYNIQFETSLGRKSILLHTTSNSSIKDVVTNLNTAIETGAEHFEATLSADFVFWLAYILLVLFATSGLFIVLVASRRNHNNSE